MTCLRLFAAFTALALTGCATPRLERTPAAADAATPRIERASPPVAAVEAFVWPVPARDDIAMVPLGTSLPEPTPLAAAVSAPADLWDRLRRGFAMPPLDTPLAEGHARRFAAMGYLTQGQTRARRYLYFIVEEVERRGLPSELALLPFVESAMNPQARSPVGATGAWQFMPETGRRFDMRISRLVDDRKNVMASTRAALDYLQLLHAQFGDWHLALSAYNWGEGNVARARERNRARGLDDTYLALRMPEETRNYVPQLEALKRLVAAPQAYGATLPEMANRPYFQPVAVASDVDVALAIEWAGVGEAEFFALNPSVKRPLLMAAATPTLLLPFVAAERFAARQDMHSGKRAGWTAITLPSTQRVEAIAARHGTTPRILRDANGIASGMKPAAGSTLLVPAFHGLARPVAAATVARASLSVVPDVVAVKLRARKGETLGALAKRSRLDAAELARWNKGLRSRSKLAAGQVLVAWVHPDRSAEFEAKGKAVNPKRKV